MRPDLYSIPVIDLTDKPICVNCRYASVEESNGFIYVGCNRVVTFSNRDIVTGQSAEHISYSAQMVRGSEVLCGLNGNWFRHKD